MLHFRAGRDGIPADIYPEMQDFYDDVAAAYRAEVAELADAGCRYLQLDDISFAYLCDSEQRQMLRDRGDDPDRQPEIYAGMVRRALQDRPADLTVTMHLCRGNFRSSFIASAYCSGTSRPSLSTDRLITWKDTSTGRTFSTSSNHREVTHAQGQAGSNHMSTASRSAMGSMVPAG